MNQSSCTRAPSESLRAWCESTRAMVHDTLEARPDLAAGDHAPFFDEWLSAMREVVYLTELMADRCAGAAPRKIDPLAGLPVRLR